MGRPLRSTYPYGVYHVTARGVDGILIFIDDDDRWRFIALLARIASQLDWTVHAYCLMGNHFHLIVECGQPQLSKGMQRLNGAYATYVNERHVRVGHLFQRRFEAWAIEDDAYLETAIAYVWNNPVRAGLCTRADAWPWSGRAADLERYARPTTTRRVRSDAARRPVTIS